MGTRLIATMGIPASGKSTWAAEQDGWVVVNKDDIRTLLEEEGWTWSQEKEADVIAIRDRRIGAALSAGLNVISSDCNLGRKHKVALEGLARSEGAEFEIKRFDTPLEVCLERNAVRTGKARVPEKAIRGMWETFIANDPDHWPLSARPAGPSEVEPYVPDPSLPPAIICDLDGTLALFKGLRGPYDASKCADDLVNYPIWRIIARFSNDLAIIYLSGREDKYREPTLEFLKKNYCPYDNMLYMRPTGDHRKDCIVKRELFDAHIRGAFNVLFVLDDRDQVVRMWRSLGLTCLQVAEGNF